MAGWKHQTRGKGLMSLVLNQNRVLRVPHRHILLTGVRVPTLTTLSGAGSLFRAFEASGKLCYVYIYYVHISETAMNMSDPWRNVSKFPYILIYINMHIYVYIYIHIHTHIYIYIYVYIYIYKHIGVARLCAQHRTPCCWMGLGVSDARRANVSLPARKSLPGLNKCIHRLL